MLRYKYNIDWKYLDVYDDEFKIKTVNYVEIDEYDEIAELVYQEYARRNDGEC